MPKYEVKFHVLHTISVEAEDLNNAELLVDKFLKENVKWETKKLSILRTDPAASKDKDSCPDCAKAAEEPVATMKLLAAPEPSDAA